MELQVVGCWAPYPKTSQACSGYLIRQGQTTCLVDCGHGVLSCLGKYIDPNDINLVLISHFHPDHYVDLHALRHVLRAGLLNGKAKAPLDLFIPNQPRDQFDYWQAIPEFTVHPIQPAQVVCYDDLEIEFYPASHPLPTYSMKCSGGGSSLFYSGDSAAYDALWEHAQKVDIMLAEASMLAADGQAAQQIGHMTTLDLARGAVRAQPGILVATHLWPGYDVDVIAGEIKSIYPGKLLMARCGLKINK